MNDGGPAGLAAFGADDESAAEVSDADADEAAAADEAEDEEESA
jgi:nucleosome binding factor SPN SPT16 subunit